MDPLRTSQIPSAAGIARRLRGVPAAAAPAARGHREHRMRISWLSILAVTLLLGASPVLPGEDALADRDRARAELRQLGQELAKLSRAFNLIHEIVAPSVLSIHTKEIDRRLYAFSGHQVIREVDVGEGSGFVFASNAKASFILTNSHVVLQTDHEQDFVRGQNREPVGYDKVKVVLNDNREVDAEYVGYYLPADLAVLKIAIPNLPAVEWADSDQAKVGDWVVALGYPMGVGYSATSGIISATDRSTGIYQSVGGFDSFIQTDAAINPGNSGGPLVNMMGQVVGINASIISRTGNNIGLGFAIPANLARRVAEDLLEHGHVSRPIIGVQIEDVSPDQAKALGMPQVQTVRVTSVVPGSPAETAGIANGDVILAVNQAKVVSLQQFQARVASCKLGAAITLRIWRGGSEKDYPMVPVAEEELNKKLAAFAKDGEDRRGVPLKDVGLWLGVDDQSGLKVTAVEAGSIAAKAGLVPGDRLLHERTLGALRTLDDASQLGAQLAKRHEVVVQVYHEGRSIWLRLRR
jgi:S1-C subfamily serine protease